MEWAAIGKTITRSDIPFINGWTVEKIKQISKGQRPSPTTYLNKEYIEGHLKKFEQGGSFLVTKSALDKYGRKSIGRMDGQFILSKTEMDVLINKANGNISLIEKELGIPEGFWRNEELVRIDISNLKQQNLRMPTGNEGGANELWLPGGKTQAGYSEVVMDPIIQGNYIEIMLIKK